jgi:hypothetical protein
MMVSGPANLVTCSLALRSAQQALIGFSWAASRRGIKHSQRQSAARREAFESIPASTASFHNLGQEDVSRKI